jgi:cobalt/nickel transport system permease protein
MTSHRKALFEGWDATLKIPSLFVLIMSMTFVRTPSLILLLPVTAVMLYLSSGLSLDLLFSAFKAPILILLFVSVFLILFSGECTLAEIGPVRIRSEGVSLALLTCIRVLSVITVGVVMIRTTPLSGLSRKLKSLMLPHTLVDIGVMTGRYISVIGGDYHRMRTARRLRGYSSGGSLSRKLAILVQSSATLLIRGFHQSERVFNAMRLRGYGTAPLIDEKNSWRDRYSKADVIMSLPVVTIAITLIVLEITVGKS